MTNVQITPLPCGNIWSNTLTLGAGSNAIVKFFRVIASAEIRINPADYKELFDLDDESVFPDYTCQTQVETRGVEAGMDASALRNIRC